MTMIKIEFPAERVDIAKAFGEALSKIGAEGGKQIEVHDEEQPAGAQTGDQVGVLDTVATGSDDHGMFTEDEIQEQENLVDPAKRDTKGVIFDPAFCGKAAKPFYASGPRQGQWKKRQGVDEDAYDDWYAREIAKVSPASTSENDDNSTPVNTGAAFGSQSQTEQQPVHNAPHDAGTLMAWVAEMQAAGRLSQEHVNQAYQQHGLTMMDVFESPNNPPEQVAKNAALIHDTLSQWANA